MGTIPVTPSSGSRRLTAAASLSSHPIQPPYTTRADSTVPKTAPCCVALTSETPR
ncbi:MAG: hypothetical protein KDE56_06825 [Anaerolineales bacterium]|nr:hypothetical protein [Anaerolineales bacterium]